MCIKAAPFENKKKPVSPVLVFVEAYDESVLVVDEDGAVGRPVNDDGAPGVFPHQVVEAGVERPQEGAVSGVGDGHLHHVGQLLGHDLQAADPVAPFASFDKLLKLGLRVKVVALLG